MSCLNYFQTKMIRNRFGTKYGQYYIKNDVEKPKKSGSLVFETLAKNDSDNPINDKRLRKVVMDKYGTENLNDILTRLAMAFKDIASRPIKEEEKK